MKETYELDILNDKKLAIRLNIYGLFVVIASYLIFAFYVSIFDGSEFVVNFYNFLDIILLFIGFLIVHELIHGLFFKVFKPERPVKYGFVSGMLYTTSPGSLYSRMKFNIIIIAPFLVLTTLLLILYHLNVITPEIFKVVGTFHTGGCTGDFYMIMLILRKCSKEGFVEDTAKGLKIYERE
ncbi:DUF3267 domain-containing protein [Staphylococcus massiliensis]|uniref:DUF3267 domain-containing protein n=1 Tax=Staphylococcus massiliensis TaxID=555791 RepID=UPI00370D3565